MRRPDRHHQHTKLRVARADSQVGQPLVQHGYQPVVLAEYVGLSHGGTAARDLAGDVDACVVGVGQQERGDHRIRRDDINQAWRVQVAERDTHAEARPHEANLIGHATGIGGRSWIGAAMRGQHQGSHDACSPHSVLDSPCQRPLRGSAPSTGLAVQGAQPIDGYPS